jgi:hypothetical protein
MTDKRETDLLAFILSGFVIAISGIAVGVASTNTNTSGGGNKTSSAVSAPASADAPASAVAPDATSALTEDHGTLTAVRRGR